MKKNEDKLSRKTAHFRWPSVALKRLLRKLLKILGYLRGNYAKEVENF